MRKSGKILDIIQWKYLFVTGKKINIKKALDNIKLNF